MAFKQKAPRHGLFARSPVESASALEQLLGSRRALLESVDRGEVQRVGGGYYAAVEIDPATAQILTVAKYFPNAVISGLSALILHELSDEVPNRVSVDIERSTSIRNQILSVKRVMSKFLIGIETRNIHGIKIRLYDRERSLCDIYRLEKDSPTFLKALKRYVKQGKVHSKKIAKYDKVLKTRVLQHIRQELADG